MSTNLVHKPGYELSVIATHPALPQSGQPVRFGALTGVALTDERADGEVTADFGPGVWNLPVEGHNGSAPSAVVRGDALFYVDAIVDDGAGPLRKDASGRFFGFAMGAVDSGATATIPVMKAPSPGNVTVAPAAPIAVALEGGNQNAFAFAWQNPEDVPILVTRVIVDVTAEGQTASAVLDVGVGATATTADDSIFDAIDITATGVFDSLLVAGAGTGGVHKLDENGGTTDWITGQILTANAADLDGFVYIEYIRTTS